MQLLYFGFTQEANMRLYRFQGVVPKARIANKVVNFEFQVRADVKLLANHNIRFQDVPSLCMQILTDALVREVDEAKCACYTVTNDDLNAYTSAKLHIEASKPPRRRPRVHYKPQDSSQLKWPVVS